MKRKIIGVTVGSPLPKPNLMQNDPQKGDYVKGKEEFLKQAESGGNVDLEGYATEQWVRDQKYLTEHQDISHKLDADKLPEAVNEALAEAKASGEFDGEDGKDGYTPVKGVDYFDGQPGKDGEDGKDGYTPVKGVDYFDGAPGKDGIDGKDGSDGYTPVKGKDYFDGENGQDGTSVTITKVTESTEDGGSNVVEFSDGKTLTVKNGSNGSDATVTEESVTNALGYVPVNVSDVFEYTNNPLFTNIFDSVDIEFGKSLSTEGTAVDTESRLATTGFIPVKAGDVIRVNHDFRLYPTGTPQVSLYDSTYTHLQLVKTQKIVADGYYLQLLESDSDGNIVSFKILRPSATAFMRICNNTTVMGSNPILTINEEIDYEMGYGEKLNPNVKVDFSQVVNVPQKNCWNILPYERLNIAYSSIGRKPINTVEHFTDAAENYEYNALKADVRPTSDGELVCCHDAGVTFDGNGKITTYDSSNATLIHDVTAATVLGYSFPAGEHPCLVGDYLDVCRTHGKVAFITIRNEYMDVVIPKLLEELKAHNMTYSTIINSMTYESLVSWRQRDTDVMINYTLSAGATIDQTQIDRAVGLGYCSLCGFGLNSSVTTPNHDCDFEYARANGIRLLQAIAYKEGSPESCYAMGYDGCQIGIPWNPKTSGGSVDTYSRTEIDAIMGSYITDINNLVGGDS